MAFQFPKNPAEFLELWLKRDWLSEEKQKILNNYYSPYRKTFNTYVKNQYNKRLDDALKIIKSDKCHNVMDIASGCGTEALYFSMLGVKSLGVELNNKRLQVAKAREKIMKKKGKSLSCNFKQGSVFQVNSEISKKFDLIFLLETLHHIEPRKKFLSLLPALLKPGGYVVVSEPNALNPCIQLRLLRKRGTKTIRSYEDNKGDMHL